jgi:poly-gamma-glutamate synthase PgsB/CapB
LNPHVRARPGCVTPGGKRLAAWVPALVARVRAERLDALAVRVEQDTRAPIPAGSDRGFARALSVEGKALLARYAEIRTQRRELRTAHASVKTDAERRSILLHHLRATVSDPRELKEDIQALDRWLDVEALIERMDRRIGDLFLDLEIIAYVFRHHPLRGEPSVLLDELLDSPRLSLRRVAVGTLAPWVAEVLRSGADRDGQLLESSSDRLDALLQLALERGGDALVARRALLAVAGMDEQNAARLLLQRLEAPQRSDRRARDDFLVRAQAVRLAVEIGPSTARNAFMVARNDPSETVRCALVQALASSPAPNARSLLMKLRDEDAARSVRTRAVIALRPPERRERDPALESLLEDLDALPAGRTLTRSLPEGVDLNVLAERLLPLVESGRGFGLEEARPGVVRVHRGRERVFRLWRLMHELRRPDPGKRQGADHLSGRRERGRVLVPAARMADVSPTEVPGRPVLSETWKSWAPWLPLPDTLLDATWRGQLHVLSDPGWTVIEPPRGLFARLRAAWSLSWGVVAWAGLRQESLSAQDPAGLAAYSEALSKLGFVLSFVPRKPDLDDRLAGMFKQIQARPSPAPLDQGGLLSVAGFLGVEALNRYLALHPVEPLDLAFVAFVIGALFFWRLGSSKVAVRRARAEIPLVLGGWGTRGKSGVARLKAALFEGLGYDVVCKTTGCEAMLLRTPPLAGAVEVYLFRPFDKATIWEQADVLGQASRLGAEVFVWECMALRPEYVEQLQLHWTQDDVSTITNTYPDHEDVMGPTGDDVADVISRFMPSQALALTTESQMMPVLRERAALLGSTLIEVDSLRVAGLPNDLLLRFPYQEHPANVTLVAELARELDLDVEEAIVLMADHVVPDLGVLATYPPLRHRGRTLEFSNGSSANERTGFLNNWRRCGFDRHRPVENAGEFLVAVINNRYDRVARSQVFAEIMVHDAMAHRYVCIGTNLEGLLGYLEHALSQRAARIDVFGGGPEAAAGRLDQLALELRICDVGAELRAVEEFLSLPRQAVDALAEALAEAVLSCPARALSASEARTHLGDLVPRLLELAADAGPVFHLRVHPDAPFHDARDQAFGRVGAGEQWVELAVEALRFASVRKACLEAVRYSAGGGAGPGDLASLEDSVRDLYREVFLSHVLVVDDYGATGDQINERIAMACPLGSFVRVMSCQNIKGTGLDLVYRWVFSRRPMEWADQLSDRDSDVRQRALQALYEWREWSIPLTQEVLRALERVPTEAFAGVRTQLVRQLGEELKARGKALHRTQAAPARERGLLRVLFHELVDPFQGIFRRWRADRIVADLAAGRVSHARAREELHKLTLVQRGELLDAD